MTHPKQKQRCCYRREKEGGYVSSDRKASFPFLGLPFPQLPASLYPLHFLSLSYFISFHFHSKAQKRGKKKRKKDFFFDFSLDFCCWSPHHDVGLLHDIFIQEALANDPFHRDNKNHCARFSIFFFFFLFFLFSKLSFSHFSGWTAMKSWSNFLRILFITWASLICTAFDLFDIFSLVNLWFGILHRGKPLAKTICSFGSSSIILWNAHTLMKSVPPAVIIDTSNLQQ